MPRPVVLLLVVLLVAAAVLFWLQSMAREVPPTRVEKPVAADVLEH